MNKVPFSTTLNLKMNTDPVRSYLQLNIWVFIINDYLNDLRNHREKKSPPVKRTSVTAPGTHVWLAVLNFLQLSIVHELPQRKTELWYVMCHLLIFWQIPFQMYFDQN